MKILLAGGSGYIGSRLRAALLEGGHDVKVLSRSADRGDIVWDPDNGQFDAGVVEGFDVVVNVVGESIDGRLTAAKKQRILDSRVKPATMLAEAIAGAAVKPATFVNMSFSNIYGNHGDTVVDESTPPGEGFLAHVANEVEAATAPAREAGVRLVLPRTSFVFGRGAAGFEPLYRLTWFGLGGRLGAGDQWWSWVSIHDAVSAFVTLIERDDLAGPFNVTAPNPMRNRDIAKALGKAMKRPSFFPAPAFALKLVLGRETPDELLLGSLRIVPTNLLEAGFEFQHATVDEALADIV